MTTDLYTMTFKGSETISCSMFSAMSITILQIQVNFNVYEHASYFSEIGSKVTGIKILSGISSTGRKSGQLSYLLHKNFNKDILLNELKQELETYFI